MHNKKEPHETYGISKKEYENLRIAQDVYLAIERHNRATVPLAIGISILVSVITSLLLRTL